MILILSSGEGEKSLKNEFGYLGSAALKPIGFKLLLEIQVEELRRHFDDRIVVSVPESARDYVARIAARPLLQQVEFCFVDNDLSLGKALDAVLRQYDPDGAIRILFGDTLIRDFETGLDVVAVAETRSDLKWHCLEPQEHSPGVDGSSLVWAGYFAISSAAALRDHITLADFDFIRAMDNYSDDLGCANWLADQWFDFGNVSTVYSSRVEFALTRVFNEVRFDGHVVTKKSEHNEKILSEVDWYRTVPDNLLTNTARLLNWSEGGYSIEVIPSASLAELFVYCQMPKGFWFDVRDRLAEYFEEAHLALTAAQVDTAPLTRYRHYLLAEKSRERLQEFLDQRNLTPNAHVMLNGLLSPSILEMLETCIEKALSVPPVYGFLHGDFCLSNIFFEQRLNSIKLIDPRGVDRTYGSEQWGDLNYDLGKLFHSINGGYDLILNGFYQMSLGGNDGQSGVLEACYDLDLSDDQAFIREIFSGFSPIAGLSYGEVAAYGALNFFSMLPLHKEDRQRQDALFFNAVRLFLELER